MRHTGLTTTTRYLRVVKERLKEAVSDLRRTASKTSDKFLGKNQNALRGKKVSKTTVSSFWKSVERVARFFGGGGQTRTVDSADMSRVL